MTNENFSTEDMNMLGLEPTEVTVEKNDDVYTDPETISKELRVISNRELLQALPAERASNPEKTKCVHIAFRPSSKDIIVLTNKLPGLEIIQLPRSYKSSFSQAMYIYLDNCRVALIEGDVWGHRRDINEWAKVNILKSVYDAAIDRFEN